MELAGELRASLQGFLSGGSVEIRETGSRISPTGIVSWEVRGAQEKPLLHLWSENCNVTRRVLAIADQSDDCITLAVERFGRTKPDRMVILRLEYSRSPRELSRTEFCEQLRRILAEQFSDETLEKYRSRQIWNILSLAFMHVGYPAEGRPYLLFWRCPTTRTRRPSKAA
jgi:hypothetical protein